ncbi:MAG: ABC transporter ATP-binding protein [Hyphomicrobiales bacterium]|nr:ABC transporter ATP-binding protein [Hyphomicrobiales bacterium]
MATIMVKDLVKHYDNVVAVNGLNFSVESGSITALLGGNGAGKTTTIAMLLGLVLPTSGDVHIFGTDMIRNRYDVLHRMNFQSPYINIPMRLTVRQNLQTFANLYGVRDINTRIEELSREFRLSEFIERPAGQLSAGQKTRASLAKALINAPELLLLDEPTASLDPDTADWVRTKLEDYRRAHGATILLASHNMAEVERLADRVLMMNRGEVVEDGTPAALMNRYARSNLEDVFLDIVRGRRQGATPEAVA